MEQEPPEALVGGDSECPTENLGLLPHAGGLFVRRTIRFQSAVSRNLLETIRLLRPW